MNILNYPLLVLVLTFLGMWLSALAGARLSERQKRLSEEFRPDFGTILAASLTMLGLIIGFTFSMATGRYDLRKTYEEAEANAIGTEHVRAGPAGSRAGFAGAGIAEALYGPAHPVVQTQKWNNLAPVNQRTSQVQNELWAATAQSAMAQPSRRCRRLRRQE